MLASSDLDKEEKLIINSIDKHNKEIVDAQQFLEAIENEKIRNAELYEEQKKNHLIIIEKK